MMSTAPLMASGYALDQYRQRRAWLREHPNPIFGSDASLDWFLRQHRDELLASGEVIIRRGSVGILLGPGFERKALEILRRESAFVPGDAA